MGLHWKCFGELFVVMGLNLFVTPGTYSWKNQLFLEHNNIVVTTNNVTSLLKFEQFFRPGQSLFYLKLMVYVFANSRSSSQKNVGL